MKITTKKKDGRIEAVGGRKRASVPTQGKGWEYVVHVAAAVKLAVVLGAPGVLWVADLPDGRIQWATK